MKNNTDNITLIYCRDILTFKGIWKQLKFTLWHYPPLLFLGTALGLSLFRIYIFEPSDITMEYIHNVLRILWYAFGAFYLFKLFRPLVSNFGSKKRVEKIKVVERIMLMQRLANVKHQNILLPKDVKWRSKVHPEFKMRLYTTHFNGIDFYVPDVHFKSSKILFATGDQPIIHQDGYVVQMGHVSSVTNQTSIRLIKYFRFVIIMPILFYVVYILGRSLWQNLAELTHAIHITWT